MVYKYIDISWSAYAIDDLIHEFDYGYNFGLKYTSELLGYPIESDCSYLKLNPQLVEEMEKIILLFDGSLNWSSPLDDSP